MTTPTPSTVTLVSARSVARMTLLRAPARNARSCAARGEAAVEGQNVDAVRIAQGGGDGPDLAHAGKEHEHISRVGEPGLCAPHRPRPGPGGPRQAWAPT